MRRIRQSFAKQSPAVVSRICVGIGLSCALHVLLICGFSLPADPSSASRVSVIEVRLDSPKASAGARPQKRPEPVDGASQSARLEPAAELPTRMPALEAGIAPAPAGAAQDDQPVSTKSATATSLSIPDPVDYPAKELDIYPQALKPIMPVYPQSARDSQIAGFVTLMVSIDAAGRVVSTSVADAAPDGVFEEVAQQALAGAAFYPAQKEGRTVRSRILIKLEFDPALADAAQ